MSVLLSSETHRETHTPLLPLCFLTFFEWHLSSLVTRQNRRIAWLIGFPSQILNALHGVWAVPGSIGDTGPWALTDNFQLFSSLVCSLLATL